VSNVGGVNIPDPGFYSSGTLPWGLDPSTSPITATLATPVAPNAQAIQSEYNLLKQQDTAELLYASSLTPAQSLINTDAVLEQAATIQDQQLAAQQQALLSNAQSQVTGSSSSTSSSTPSSDVSNLPSVTSILAASDAAAQSVLSNYANAPTGSSIVDYQA
jgi:hypothetical protein